LRDLHYLPTRRSSELHARRSNPEIRLVYDTLEQFMEGVMAAIEAGERDVFRDRLSRIELLLLDDVQFLAGRHRTQEEVIRFWDADRKSTRLNSSHVKN